jgi:glycosyltransferase involved in cell wall biosynthesis
MFALADTIICYGYAEKNLLSALFPHKRILVAGNSTVRAEDCRPLETLAAQRCSVLFLGRMVKAKKPMLLLRALHVLQGEGQHIGAVFVGEGPERVECETFARSKGLENIVFAGEEFFRSRIRQLAADCFAVASPGYVGLSVLDALSMGLPVAFSHDEPNAPEVEVLEEATCAVAFKGDSPQSLAHAIKNLYNGRVDWLGRGGRLCDTIKDRYSIARMASQFTEFFRRAHAGES